MNKRQNNDASGRAAFRLLHPLFSAIAIVTGVDKFFNVLTKWERYLPPVVKVLCKENPRPALKVIGVAEVGIGVLNAVNPKMGSLALAGLFGSLVLNLLTMKDEKHLAFLDFSFLVCALALHRLAMEHAD